MRECRLAVCVSIVFSLAPVAAASGEPPGLRIPDEPPRRFDVRDGTWEITDTLEYSGTDTACFGFPLGTVVVQTRTGTACDWGPTRDPESDLRCENEVDGDAINLSCRVTYPLDVCELVFEVTAVGAVSDTTWDVKLRYMDTIDGPANPCVFFDGWRDSCVTEIHSVGRWISSEGDTSCPDTAVVPVMLLSFTAMRGERESLVEWEVADPSDHAGFHLYRRETGANRIRLTPALLTGRTRYAFRDPAVPSAGAEYWLAEVSRTGSVTWLGPALLVPANPAVVARPAQVHPNPARSEVVIQFAVRSRAEVEISICDVAGRVLRTVEWSPYEPGDHRWTWDARNDAGVPVRAGLYFFVVRSGDEVQSGKIAVVR